jgi:hypothetical protein
MRIAMYEGDCLNVMRGFRAASVDLVMCSPPYEAARTYGVGFKLRGREWVEWAADRFMECLRISRGLVVWVVEGQTRQYEWSATPMELAVEIKRRGAVLRKPPVFARVGIPGSGGPDWWRNDYEFCVCATPRRGKLPWSDACVMGHPPLYSPGGAPSHRTASGNRVNSGLSYWSIRKLISDYCDATQANASEVLLDLRKATESEAIPEWLTRITAGLRGAQVLQSVVCGGGESQDEQAVSGGRQGKTDGSPDHTEASVSEVRFTLQSACSPQGREPTKQHDGKPGGFVQRVSPEGAPCIAAMSDMWRKKPVQKTLREALQQVEAAWRSLAIEDQSILTSYSGSGAGLKVITRNRRGSRDNGVYRPPERANPGNVIRCHVGGGAMGDRLCHENEAPFPEALAERFIRSFCPPDGVVLDCFGGSGTVGKVAAMHGRNAVLIDIRSGKGGLDTARRRIEAFNAANPDKAVQVVWPGRDGEATAQDVKGASK